MSSGLYAFVSLAGTGHPDIVVNVRPILSGTQSLSCASAVVPADIFSKRWSLSNLPGRILNAADGPVNRQEAKLSEGRPGATGNSPVANRF